MDKPQLKKLKIPTGAGVYFFLGPKKEILYIGKATSLKQRVSSYFDVNLRDKRSLVIEKMVHETKGIVWTETDSVLEAMLLEVNLIRTHKPVYNTRSKDDKSYNHVVITNDTFPRVLVIRGKDLLIPEADKMYTHIYGPFPNGALFKEALKIIRKLFQFYDTDISQYSETNKMYKGKVDFNRQIGLYPELCSTEEYAKTINHIQLFFEGKKHHIIADLEKQMFALAKKKKFEEAHIIKKKIFALKHIHDISLLKDESRVYKDEKNIRIEAYDIAHMNGQNMVGVMAVIVGGQPSKNDYRKFSIKGFTSSNDPGALAEMFERRVQHSEWNFPDLIVVDGSTAQKNVVERILKKYQLPIPVVGVVKDDKHNPVRIIGSQKLITEHKKSILYANAESHRFAIIFHTLKRTKNFLK